jgi:LacI family transcriptional regulator
VAARNVTIKDVALRAGFSISTVSHVINETRFVESETREKILRAIEELGYRPNILARSLKGKGTKTIGVIISDIRQGFFAEVIKSIESRANEREFNVMLCDSEDDADKEELYLDILLRKGVDGVIFAPVDTNQLFEELWLSELPCVQVDRKLRAGEADFVGIDNAGSAEQATRRLFENGYGEIGFIGYRPGVYTMAERHRGYGRAVAAWGKKETSLLIVDYQDADCTASIRDWLQHNPQLDALLCGNDDICYAALNAIPDVGKSIPSTMGIISFDEIRWYSMMTCPITAIEQPTGKIGTAAVDLLVDRIEGKRDEAAGEFLFDTELIVRKSCMRGGGSRDRR